MKADDEDEDRRESRRDEVKTKRLEITQTEDEPKRKNECGEDKD